MNLKQLRSWMNEHSDHPDYYEKILDKKLKKITNNEVFITLTLRGVDWKQYETPLNSEGNVGSWIISELFQDYNHIFEMMELDIKFTNWRVGFIKFKILNLFYMITQIFQEVI